MSVEEKLDKKPAVSSDIVPLCEICDQKCRGQLPIRVQVERFAKAFEMLEVTGDLVKAVDSFRDERVPTCTLRSFLYYCYSKKRIAFDPVTFIKSLRVLLANWGMKAVKDDLEHLENYVRGLEKENDGVRRVKIVNGEDNNQSAVNGVPESILDHVRSKLKEQGQKLAKREKYNKK